MNVMRVHSTNHCGICNGFAPASTDMIASHWSGHPVPHVQPEPCRHTYGLYRSEWVDGEDYLTGLPEKADEPFTFCPNCAARLR